MSAYSNQKLYDVLLQMEVVEKSLLDQCLSESEEQGKPLDEVLAGKDLISNTALGPIISDLISVPYVDLSKVAIPPNVLRLIPEHYAKAQQAIVFKLDKEGMHVATTNPTNKLLYDSLMKKTGYAVKIYYTTASSVRKALMSYAQEVTKAFSQVVAESVRQIKARADAEPPIIKIVDMIITYAYQSSASDIHIEPLREDTLVRFRIDGVLHDIVKLPLELFAQIVTRVKVMSNLRTDEHQEAQDGKLVFDTSNENLDVRISIVPITKGEKVVMRLLSEQSRQFALLDLGLSKTDREKVERAYHNPHGMILATGPTGSGKTTTLYAILKLLNRRDVNIMTIEDPVEYQIDNINQIQVNVKTDLTFAKGLRSIVRQDPDIVLVGEVRDDETANIAVNSSMTGHLVLSSLHTNDAATTFPRLMDMHIEPYLIASTVNMVIAQRLVRKICSKCRVSQEIDVSRLDEGLKKFLGSQGKLLIYKGKGCDVCCNTGYAGRIGIYEVLEMGSAVQEAVIAKKSAQEIHEVAVVNGMKTMLMDGVEKVKQGITTLDDLLRVTRQ